MRDNSQSNTRSGSRLIARVVLVSLTHERWIVLLTCHFAARSHREAAAAMRFGLAEIFSKECGACELAFGAYPY